MRLANTVPWVTPINPGPFVPPANGTAAQIEAAKDVWRESKYDFTVCQATEKAIVAQIVDAIDKNYIRTLLNRTTGQYSTDIRGVLRHLFTTYGKITPQHVKQCELTTYNMQYDISQPVDNVFDAIEDLVDLAEHGHSPMTSQQMIDTAYIIFAKQPILKQDLREWNRKPLIERTWANMVTHLRDAQSDLNAFPVAADIYNQQPAHQANAVETIADLVAQRLMDAWPNEEAPVPAPAQAPVIAPLPDTVNAAIQQRESSIAAREAALDTRLQEMMALMRTNTGTTPPVRGPRKYCWSHGSCAHDGHGCETKSPGHKVEATFKNMMGGSTKNCYWLSTVVPPLPRTPTAILDSGATGTFVTSTDALHLRQSTDITNGPRVLSANGDPMQATHQGLLPLSSSLSPHAQSAFVLDDLRTGSLVSLAQLCDDDCIAIFNKYDVKILKKDNIIITGTRMPNGLWSVPIDSTTTHQANGILRLDRTKAELASYHHASLGSPVPSTLLRAIRRGHLTTFPGLTTNLISKHLPKSLATTLGHQDQEAKNLRSTRTPAPETSTTTTPTTTEEEEVVEDIAPTLATRTHQICAMLFDKKELLKSYSDQTGRFHTPSSRGNNYIFVLYHPDTNSIHAVAIPNRQAASIRDAWETTHKLLVHQGHAPELHILDNECSQSLKEAFAKYHVNYQRVPPKNHRANAAERAIRTFKNHFVSVLCTIDSQFPLSEWDRLLPQTLLTLNLLRSSRIHPSLSAQASLFGNFDYNRTPIAPPGTRIVAHESSTTRTTFGQHGKVGWYIGPALEHYRCWKCYFADTHHERDVLTVDFSPEKIPFPQFTRDEYLQQTAEDMLHLLQQKPSSPLHDPLSFGPPILNAFTQVAEILGRAIKPPTASTDTPPTVPVPPTIPAPVPPPRVEPAVPAAVPPPRVVPKPASPVINRTGVGKKLPPPPPSRHSPRTRLSRTRFDPRTHRRTFLAQTVQHDPSIPGKIYNQSTGRTETLDSLLAGNNSPTWTKSLSNEWGRCMQGLSGDRPPNEYITGNNTMFFIFPNQVPVGRKVTYANFLCTMRPGKAEPLRVRMTVGGDKLDAYQDVRSPAVGLIDAKLHWNSVISDSHRGARYCTGDMKDFFSYPT